MSRSTETQTWPASSRGQASIGVVGLGTMGRSLARNLGRHGSAVALHNRTRARIDDFIAQHGDEGDFVPCASLEQLVDALQRPRAIVLFVRAGAATDEMIDALAPLLEEGDMLVDAGNSHPADTARREETLRGHGLSLVGLGVSGGEEGALHGPSLMPGGSRASYERLGPIFERISAHVDGVPCCVHVGPGAAGHFVKMVHNGIEYADMQLIAEAYDLMRELTACSPGELAKVFEDWNRGDLESFLIEITAQVLGHTDAETGKPFVDVVRDEAGQKGTGRWTVQNALELGVPVTGIAEAAFARALSAQVDRREAVRDRFVEDPSRPPADSGDFIEDVRKALFASKIVAYAQGFDQIRAGAQESGWSIDLGQMAMIWRGGCIIRARFLERVRQAYTEEPDLPSLLAAPYFAAAVRDGLPSWRRVTGMAVAAGVPTPAFSSLLAYFDGLRRRPLPASLIQALRDNFGAHSYQRIDKAGRYHTLWSEEPPGEIEV